MNSLKRLLTIRFIIVLAFWQLIGVAAMIFSPFLYLYLGLIPILVWVVLQDKKSFPAADAFIAQIDGPSVLRLEDDITWTFNLKLEAHSSFSRFLFFFPSSPLFISDQINDSLATGCRSWQVQQKLRAVALGREEIHSLTLIASSPLGWWQAIYQIKLEQHFSFHVKPSLQPLPEERLSQCLQPIQHLMMGSRLAMRSRNPEQFHSIRRYRYPDSVRFIDAKKTARTQQLMVREYESLVQHQLVIVLDLGRSLLGNIGSSRKQDFYLEAVLTLYQSALEFQDKVSFFAFHQELVHISKGHQGFQELHALLLDNKRLQAKDVEANYELIPTGVRRLTHQRSIVLVLSDINRPSVQASLLQNLSLLSRQHLMLNIGILEKSFQIDHRASPKQEAAAWALDLYRFWLDDEFAKFARSMSRIGSGAILCPERHWLDLNRKLYQLLRHSLRV